MAKASRLVEEVVLPSRTPLPSARVGATPHLLKLPKQQDKSQWIARHHLTASHEAGTPWRDMAVLYRHYDPSKQVLSGLRKLGIPASYQKDIRFDANQDTVRVMTFHSSKGLEFPLVVIPGADSLTAADEEEAQLKYVAMTRATEKLVVGGEGGRF